MTADSVETRVRERLPDVLDPCSCFTEEPVDIVSLGLVETVTVEDGTATVELLLTSPACTYAPYIERDVTARVSSVDGVDSVRVEQVIDAVWTRDRMEKDVRASRRQRLPSRLEAAGIEPHFAE